MRASSSKTCAVEFDRADDGSAFGPGGVAIVAALALANGRAVWSFFEQVGSKSALMLTFAGPPCATGVFQARDGFHFSSASLKEFFF